MVVSQVMKDVKKTRHRLKEIKLEPGKSNYAVSLRILVDGIEAHKLPPVKKRQPLCWVGLSLPCDLHLTSQVTVEVTEIHTIQDQVGLATFSASDVEGKDMISIGCNNETFTVKLTFLSREDAQCAYSDAFDKVQQMEKPQGILEKAGKVGLAFKTLLSLGSTMADLDPTGGATVAFALCTKALEHIELQDKQNADLNKLVEDLAAMTPSVELVKDLANTNLKETVANMLNLIEDASLFILSHKWQNSWTQALYSIVDSTSQDKIQGFIMNFERLSKTFDSRVNVQNLETTETDGIDSRLKELKPVDLAHYNPTRACIRGTRINITNDVTTWALETDADQRLAWIQGLAGLGKSSIATSVCERLKEHQVLATSFFCKRDSPELRDPRRVLTTIVHGLAIRWKPYRDAVVAAMRADPELHTLHIQPLYEALVNKPLRDIPDEKRPSGTLVIVVDALDECGDSDTRKQLLICLRGMVQLAPWLKVIVTSRPDPDIQEFFGQIITGWFTEYNVLSYDALDDIRILIPELLGNAMQIDGWPEDAVENLSLRSSGLFIWARTACKFITDGLNPRKRLEQVLSGARLADSTAQLDALYKTAIEIGALDGDEDNLSDVLECLSVVIVTATRAPLSAINLEKLLRGRIPLYTLDRVVRSLSSVLYADQKQGGAIRVSHPSFMDYITDRSRSKELCIDLEQQETVLAECCLETLMHGLKFNICELETSYLLNCNVPNLETRVQKAIIPYLAYSCVYWTSHLAKSRQGELVERLREFLFDRKLLYWIEAMSLLGKLSIALSSLLELTRFLPDSVRDCRTYVYDTYRFVLAFYHPISESTPHLYISALGLAPDGSEMVQRMRLFFPSRLSVVRGADKAWTPCLVSIWASGSVHSAMFSPDSRRIVSGSKDGMVRIWDAETGNLTLGPLEGHSGWVKSVAFSPNGRRIVSSAEDMTLRIWDTETGRLILGPLEGHSDWVNSVSFSPDGRRIVSGSGDCTVRIWDAEMGQLMCDPMKGHSKSVNSVAFSPDGRRIVSGAGDKTVQIWDAETDHSMLQPMHGHTGYISSVVFSPDGQRIASGSYDKTIRIWDSETGQMVYKPMNGHVDYVYSVAFSPDGQRIVSGSNDFTIRIWDAETGLSLLEPMQGHCDAVYSAAFSPDSRHIVSGSSDGTVRIWDAEANGLMPKALQGCSDSVQSATLALNDNHIGLDFDTVTEGTRDAETGMIVPQITDGHSDVVYSVAFSPDGRLIVSGSLDNTVRIWDSVTGKSMLDLLEGHFKNVFSVSFSPDGRRIVSGSGDNTVRIWDVETGRLIFEPLRGHSDGVHSVAFSPDNQHIISGSWDGVLRIWDAETGELVSEFQKGSLSGMQSVAFSPNNRLVASGFTDSSLAVWDAETGEEVFKIINAHSDYVNSVVFLPDGKRIVSGSGDGTIRIWDMDVDQPTREPILGHSDAVCSVAVSPDGRRIVSGSDDKTVRIWDVQTGRLILEPLRGHSSGVRSVSFSPDGRRIVSGSLDGTVRVWNAEPYIVECPLPPTIRYLPGAEIALLPEQVYSELVSSSFQLTRNISPSGWVTTSEGNVLLWLPPEFRQSDDSLICIPPICSARELILDFSMFVHGNSWASIACI